MAVKNSYPQLPEVAYQKTSIDMPTIVAFAKGLIEKYDKDTVRMAYAIFRNESGNGKYGVNNNYAGIQADAGVWKCLPGVPIGTTVKIDNAGDTRRFLVFNKSFGYQISFELLCIKIVERGIRTTNDYYDKWVAVPRLKTESAVKNFNSLLNSSKTEIK